MSNRKRIARARRNAFRARMFRQNWNTCREEVGDFFRYYILTPFGILALSVFLGISISLISMVYAAGGDKTAVGPHVTEYTASEYDLEAMADRLNLEPVYIYCGDEIKENRIVETYTVGKAYTYKYEIYISDEENEHLWDEYKLNRNIGE